MMPRTVRVIADDLTGACDATIAFGASGILSLSTEAPGWRSPEASLVAVDTDSRTLTNHAAVSRVLAASCAVSDGDVLFKKVDSTLRGHLGEELAALSTALRRRAVILAPAFPSQGRTTVAGVQRVAGVPLHRTGSWSLEEGAAPRSIQEALGSARSLHVDLRRVRGGSSKLTESLRSAEASGSVAVCDAECDSDLTAIVSAAQSLGSPVLWAGSAGLAGALAARLPPIRARGGRVELPDASSRVLAVVGSAAQASSQQANELVRCGFEEIVCDPARVMEPAAAVAGLADQVAATLSSRNVLVRVVGPLDQDRAGAITGALAEVVLPAARTADLLVLTGGATARAVLERLGIESLQMVAESEPGVVLSNTGRAKPSHVITKAGAFGRVSALSRAVQFAHTGGSK